MNLIMKRAMIALLVIALAFAFSYQAIAAPVGGTLTNYSTDTGPTTGTPNRTDVRGSITTVLFDSTTQDQNWKGYVGNVTGGFALRNTAGDKLYDWSSASVSGEVYATNASSADFSGTGALDCTIAAADYTANNAYYSMAQGAGDTINGTFNATAHQGFTVGNYNPTAADTCPSIALWNGSLQPASSSAPFQEVLFQEGNGYFVFMSIINDDTVGFDGDTYDFQMIVPESDTGSPNTYYFYVELTV